MRELDTFTKAYIECALWSSTDNNYEPLDNGEHELSKECLNKMITDCTKFQTEWQADIVLCERNEGKSFQAHENLKQAGHDFWLTRNHHGAGFWDGDWPKEIGEKLTKASKTFAEVNLYVGDDGFIYC